MGLALHDLHTFMLQPRQFQRVVEDFICENCGFVVTGNGYRNHCPQCLQSKHVDIYPGDRAANCGGAMIVVDLVLEHGQYIITHQCTVCRHTKRNKTHTQDSMNALLDVMHWLQQ